MNHLYFILLGSIMGSCMGVVSVDNGTLRSFEPSYESSYDVVDNLRFGNQSLLEIARIVNDKYGLTLCVPIDTMDMLLKLEGDEQEILQFLSDLFVRYPFRFLMQGGTGDLWVGLEGDESVLTKITDLIINRFQVEDSKKGSGIRIDLKGEQIPCWQAIGKIAQRSGLGIDYGTVLYLEKNNRQVLAYQKASPFYLYVSKELTTGKLILDLLYSPKVTTDVWEIDISNVFLSSNGIKREISGCTLTALAENPTCSARVEWISNDPIQWEKGMVIEGLIQGPVLTREYHIENLGKNASIKGNDLAITAQITENFQIPEGSSGVYFEPDEMEGEWVCVNISVVDNLSREEKLFLQEIDKKRLERRQLSNEETTRHNILRKEKMAVIKVYSLGKPNESYRFKRYGGVYFFNSVTGIEETTLYFDSVQDGMEIFPLFLELRRYEPKQYKFSVEIP